MLNKFDDFPIHQTPEPIAHLASSDRNAYDRTWMNGYSIDGSAYFALGLAVYPHRGILDCAFSVVEAGGRQHCFFGSRRAPAERSDTSCGPFRLEVVEPMRRMRVVLDDNPSGVSCDLTFSARTAPIQEARQTLWQGSRRWMDATRFDQFGRWSGTVGHPDGGLDVDDEAWWGTKDRSWGVRSVGEPETGGAPPLALPSLFFLWAPLVWDDHISHAIFFDGPRGEPLAREGLTAPLFDSEAAVPEPVDARDERMSATHRVRYVPGTRLAASAQIDLADLSGAIRRIDLDPVLKFQMKGIGYTHPEWGHGRWKGELELAGESYDPDSLDPLAFDNLHVQQVVRARDSDGRHGIGVLEQIAIGPHEPSGLTGLVDGFTPPA